MKKKHSDVTSCAGILPSLIITFIGVGTSVIAIVCAVLEHLR